VLSGWTDSMILDSDHPIPDVGECVLGLMDIFEKQLFRKMRKMLET